MKYSFECWIHFSVTIINWRTNATITGRPHSVIILKSLFYILSTRPKSPLIVCQCIHSIRLPVLFTYFADIIVLFVVALFRLLITAANWAQRVNEHRCVWTWTCLHFDLSDSIFHFDHFYIVDIARNRLPERGETSFIFEKHDTRKHGYELLSPLDFI